ncbi:hypothetical protein [Salmonella enterica]|uniref:hypothetical protein n=1 Tax=Salmonella enterica TaxID=28901 RepID=UPI00247E4496|nr:hypothetical protein [Salmonella enterica]EKT7776864.1 hypothetical protein [Salmonella enterica]
MLIIPAGDEALRILLHGEGYCGGPPVLPVQIQHIAVAVSDLNQVFIPVIKRCGIAVAVADSGQAAQLRYLELS